MDASTGDRNGCELIGLSWYGSRCGRVLRVLLLVVVSVCFFTDGVRPKQHERVTTAPFVPRRPLGGKKQESDDHRLLSCGVSRPSRPRWRAWDGRILSRTSSHLCHRGGRRTPTSKTPTLPTKKYNPRCSRRRCSSLTGPDGHRNTHSNDPREPHQATTSPMSKAAHAWPRITPHVLALGRSDELC